MSLKFFVESLCGLTTHKPKFVKKTNSGLTTVPLCLREEEFVLHALWECSSAKDVWSQCSKLIQKSALNADNFKGIFEAFNEVAKQDTIEEFAMIARKIWMRRNEFMFKGSSLHPSLVV